MTNAKQLIGLLNTTLRKIRIVTDKDVTTETATFIMLGLLNNIEDNEKHIIDEFAGYCLEHYSVDLLKTLKTV